ncbi:EAL domain-containing response regulator [Nitrincola sp. MINF-07-Sa-05]|uniref:EAL domain-containing response regulator n=1 Tax=Nitrincola salilacus TaxID=3400273 RepID=UPI003918049A
MSNLSALQVLLVDDDPLMLKLISHQLNRQGCKSVTNCLSAYDALDAISSKEQPFDLILTDLNMPGMDGMAFVRHLVDHQFKGSLILFSGEDKRILQSVEKMARAHKLSVLGYLSKPIDPDSLMELLYRWSPVEASSTATEKKNYHADELRQAIENNQLINFYQPKVCIRNGKVSGFEALIRWQHPTDGMVFPDQFITLAENEGLIDDLTQVVLRNALTQLKSWQDSKLDINVAINISMDNLSKLSFAEQVLAEACQAGVEPEAVVLEVTESKLMVDQRAPLEVLARLKLNRFRFSIDDFGTGHSSLAQLNDLPFDELKIDQRFVHGAHSRDTARAIFDASIRLAHQLGMTVIAEGVEDIADWEFLRQRHCHLAQGYFIARPMPPHKIQEWMGNWAERVNKLCPENTQEG